MAETFDLAELKRRMQGALATLKHEFGGLRTGRASASLLEPVHVDAYGQATPLNQVATISVPEPRLLSVQVWDKALGRRRRQGDSRGESRPSPTIEGQILRIRMPELNEQRRKELVKVAHKYAEEARVAVRHVRRDGLDILKKLLKDHAIPEDDEKRHETRGAEGDRRDGEGDRRRARRQGKRNHAGLRPRRREAAPSFAGRRDLEPEYDRKRHSGGGNERAARVARRRVMSR